MGLLHLGAMESTIATDVPAVTPTARALVRGSFWVAAGRTVAALCRLAVSVVAARMLLPADFGLMGVATLVTVTLESLSETGVERAFVQRKDAAGYADVAWTLLLGRSLLLSLITLALAQPLAAFYEQPLLLPILATMALSIACGGARNLSNALLNRQLAFQKLFAIELARGVAHLGVGLTLLFVFRSVWALVASHLMSVLVEVVISYVAHPHRPRLALQRDKAIELLRFGRWVSAVGVTALLVTRADDMFIGKYLGPEALGLYLFAYEIANIPVTHITHVLGRVSFPAYARLHAAEAHQELSASFARVMRTTLLISAAVTVTIGFHIDALIAHALGPQWAPTIPIVRILLVGGFLRSWVGLAASLFHAVGRPDMDLRMNVPRLLLLLVLIWPACAWAGLAGAAWLVAFSVASCVPAWVMGVRQLTGMTWSALITQTTPALVVGALLSLGFVTMQWLLPAHSAPLALLRCVGGLSISVTLLWAIERTTSLRILHELRDLRAALRG